MNSDNIIDRNEKEKIFIYKYKPDLNSLSRVLSRDARIPFVTVIRPHRKTKDVTSQLITFTLKNTFTTLALMIISLCTVIIYGVENC